MSCCRPCDYRRYIFSKYKLLIVWPVEDEDKLMLRMLLYNTPEDFLYKISVAFQVTGQQKSGINSHSHTIPAKVLGECISSLVKQLLQ